MKSFYAGCVISLFIVSFAHATVFYVSTTGSDITGNGTSSLPWKTLQTAVSRVAANQGHTIQLAQGTYIENGLIAVPAGISIVGAGMDLTVLKAAAAFFYNPETPGYATDKFLLSLKDNNQVNGNQTLSGFTIDGGTKQLHGGIYVNKRSNIIISAVKVKNTNFTGIWLWDVKDSKILNSEIINASWGSVSYCSGALNLGNLERVEIDGLKVDESTGYGIKAIGPSGNNNILYLKIHNSRISVNPFGLWNGGSAPNIAIELWSVNLVGNEIYDSYVDNTISLVNSNQVPSTGIQTIRVHHNIIDIETRAQGAGYGVELTVHDAEIDHNYFLKGNYGIANWDHPMSNWNIHHNTFYALQGTYPGEIVRSQWSGLHNVKVFNNTIEFAGTKTMNFLGLYGGASDNVDVQNNVVINNNTSYSYYSNELIHLENGAALTGLKVKHNSIYKMPVGTVPGTYQNNRTTDPKINGTGNRPDPYYKPATGSPLIDAGLIVSLPYTGTAPDIGAFEFAAATNALPNVTITSPSNNASFAVGSTVTINATATDTDGTIAKVEFYHGTTLLGQDLSSPFTFSWSNVPAGNYSITARATDNLSGVKTSPAVSISVSGTNTTLPTAVITTPLNNANFVAGSTVTINATATDTGGTIAKVEFYKGTILLGQDLTSPYTFSWTNVPAGNHSLTVRATDNQNGTKVSTAVAIVVTATNVPPVATFTSPANNSVFSTGASLTLSANATDSDGQVTKVEFFSGSTLLGQRLVSPWTMTWSPPSAGSYALTAKVTDNAGATTLSSTVTISVVTPATVQLGFDSSDAVLSGGMTAGSDASAAMGSYFSMPTGSGRNYYIPAPAKATFNFNLSAAGNFVVWVKTKSLSDQNQGHYVYDGKGNWIVWSSGVHASWTWSRITNNSVPVMFSFNQGANAFNMFWYDENAQVDQIIITNDLNFIPAQDVAPATALTVFPNPVKSSTFTIRYTSPSAQLARVSLFNYASALVHETSVNLTAGTNDIVVDVSYIYNGPYILYLQPTAGGPLSTPIVIDH